ncbi:hypothetical protein M902_0824 [Bacteriovorax sp. BAL6_X]|uniref:hypothetical protein n=1 Tax=Bacteriovorax sp. BAL6_X TaxID=1201290 RepID=UPI0003867FF5|nr:hypothetical protein [Bacteriovorax sp. BAL6_X]EPZ49639.1 hypothetical protein M902_0824 [Bacteriovorax sp. BAL6_X]
MLKKTKSCSFSKTLFYDFGIELGPKQYQKIRSRLDGLMDRCPIHSHYKLTFKKHETNYIGQLSIKSFSKNFHAKKVAHTPLQVFLLLEEAIDEQLLKWKRDRFSNRLARNLRGPQVA